VEAGRFREDLLPPQRGGAAGGPLRERIDDIPALVHHFTPPAHRRWAWRPALDPRGRGGLQAYPWPGNVRELRNLIERCCCWASARRILAGCQPKSARSEEGYPLEWALAEVEKAHILQVVASHDGNKSAASRVLGWRKTLERKFKEWAIRAGSSVAVG
jgi:DNA-binding NtrC family response regulator